MDYAKHKRNLETIQALQVVLGGSQLRFFLNGIGRAPIPPAVCAADGDRRRAARMSKAEADRVEAILRAAVHPAIRVVRVGEAVSLTA